MAKSFFEGLIEDICKGIEMQGAIIKQKTFAVYVKLIILQY